MLIHHDVLLQHLQSRGAVGLKQCMDHLVQLSLLLSRDRIPGGGGAEGDINTCGLTYNKGEVSVPCNTPAVTTTYSPNAISTSV